jgi:SSS family solute:Na+ symporter
LPAKIRKYFLPEVLYTVSLFMKTVFGLDASIITLAIMFAIVGSCYAVLAGLRAAAISDTYSGVLLLSLAVLTTLTVF